MNSLFKITQGIPDKQDELITYNACFNGLYMTKKLSGGGLLTIKIDDKINAALPKGEERIIFLKRKIPFDAFLTIINFFRYVSKHFGETLEAYAIIGYSNTENKYRIWIPEHVVSGASVQYDISKFNQENPGYYIVMDIHSHPWKGSAANFSGIDNADDKRDRFSGVIGSIESVMPNMKFRFSANGRFWDMDIDDLFEQNNETFHLEFKDEIKKITVHNKNNIGLVTKSPFEYSRILPVRNVQRSTFLDAYINGKKRSDNFTIKDLMGEDW